MRNVLHYREIEDAFTRRVERREFATIKYLVYLQFAALVKKDALMINDLLMYGFDTLYPKLRWLDKVAALEIA